MQGVMERTGASATLAPGRMLRRKDSVPVCDLCGSPAAIRFEVSEFGFGEFARSCKQCREKLRQARAEARLDKLKSTNLVKLFQRDSHPRDYDALLTILTPGFKLEDLIPKVACHWILGDTKRALASIRSLARRAS